MYFQGKLFIVTSIFASQILQVIFFLWYNINIMLQMLSTELVLNPEYLSEEKVMKLSWTLLTPTHLVIVHACGPVLSTKHDYWEQPAGVTCTQPVRASISEADEWSTVPRSIASPRP